MKRTTDHIYDELLVLRCQDGDSEALKELIDRWHTRLRRIVYRLTDGHDEGEDITQVVWMTVVRKISRLNDPATFPQWLYRIANAKCADWVRRQKRVRKLKETARTELAGTDEPDDSDHQERLRTALKQLPPEQKALLTMFYLDEMSVDAISDALNIPPGTVKSRLFYARNQLRKQLERSLP